MPCREESRGRPRDKRGCREPNEVPHRSTATPPEIRRRLRRGGPPPPTLAPFTPGGVSTDQRGRRGERHLETRSDDLMRGGHHDGKRGKREIAHADRGPVEQHRYQHDRKHDEAPLGGDTRAGYQEVEGDRRERDGGCVFLRWM